jgi:hypothetical protein
VSAFFCVVMSCVGRGLALDWSPNKGVLPNVYRIEKSIKEGIGPQRTVESHRKKNCIYIAYGDAKDSLYVVSFLTLVNFAISRFVSPLDEHQDKGRMWEPCSGNELKLFFLFSFVHWTVQFIAKGDRRPDSILGQATGCRIRGYTFNYAKTVALTWSKG